MRHAILTLVLAGCAGGAGGLAFDAERMAQRAELSMEDTVAMLHRGDHLYVAAGPSELAVVDISDPLTPTEVGRWTSGIGNTQTTALLWLDDLVVMAVGWDVYVLDVSDPTSPQVVSRTGMEVHIVGLALSGDTLAVWGDGVNPTLDRLYVLDLSDPAAPALGGFVPFDWARSTVQGVGGGRFVGGAPDEATGGGLALLDATDLATPTFGAPSAAPGGFVMAVEGDDAYVHDQRDLHVVDVRDPAAPTLRFSRDLVAFDKVLLVGGYVGITHPAGVWMFPKAELETLPDGIGLPVPTTERVQALVFDSPYLYIGAENVLYTMQELPD
ncbi:MAG: hypothetical protein H6733_16210 [Alphaproteobacteria bacterium]|nr:hypothetical protein [Alphaproteobacteria bacterium]